jgi:hypothetical protein
MEVSTDLKLHAELLANLELKLIESNGQMIRSLSMFNLRIIEEAIVQKVIILGELGT